jgi:hypothetical protein
VSDEALEGHIKSAWQLIVNKKKGRRAGRARAR